MLLKYFYDQRLAQASYLVGCAATGEALVVDPARDITRYLETAEAEGLRITHVTETHIHADFVSGGRELAAQTGAALYLSAMGDENWQYTYDDGNVRLVRDGDIWMVGNVKVEVLHTPGHTPEHIAFMITDTAGADQPMGIFTGDFLFVGDVGRPDLLEEAAGMVGTADVGAHLQYHTVARFKDLPDYLQIWPGHGAGSACGKALGAIPSTTLGYEKLFNPAFQFNDEEAFVNWLLDGQPEAPRYFARMKHVNKVGPLLLRDVPAPAHLDRAALDAALANGDLVIDLRHADEFADAYLPGSISIPHTDGSYINYVGWFVDYACPTYLIVPETALTEILVAMRSIGVDQIAGYCTPDVISGETATLYRVDANELAARAQHNDLVILDVRGASEYSAQHISGAQNIPLGYIPNRLNDLPRDHTIVTQCASGYRSQIAASVLRKYGFTAVINLNDNTQAWAQALPTEQN
ncbi:MAG: MBL fold metallo-hydrolase [Chloroflexi bacterium]|nr:MBL fold metallo-hydrolase [Chloroflexota bacterium]